jgi:hypothetical protein
MSAAKPIGGGGAGNANSLGNLQPGAGAGDGGLQRARSHGGYAAVLPERLERKTRELYETLAEVVPLGDDAALPRQDAVLVMLLAKAMIRLEDVERDISAHGFRDQRKGRKGEYRRAVEVEASLRREIKGYLLELANTTRARAAVGVDVARAFDLAMAMSDPDRERGVEAMREAGLADA